MAECFGAKGYNVVTPEELRRVLSVITKDTPTALPAVVNIVISGSSERKPQVKINNYYDYKNYEYLFYLY